MYIYRRCFLRKRKYTKELLIEAVSESKSVREVLKTLGTNPDSGGMHSYISGLLREYKIDTSHFLGQAIWKGRELPCRPKKIPLSKILVKNSSYPRQHLKKRLLNEKLIENICSECGQEPEWNGEPLIMILDHINGINNDHRRENLRMLCPNCNAQQPTFSGRNNLRK